jgi:hypothetical protein
MASVSCAAAPAVSASIDAKSGVKYGPLVYLALGTLAIGTEGFMIAAFLPSVAASLSVSVQLVGLLVTVFTLIFAVTVRGLALTQDDAKLASSTPIASWRRVSRSGRSSSPSDPTPSGRAPCPRSPFSAPTAWAISIWPSGHQPAPSLAPGSNPSRARQDRAEPYDRRDQCSRS